jgi:GAF domain-containing protein
MDMISVAIARHTAGVRCRDSGPSWSGPWNPRGPPLTAGTCPSGALPHGAQYVNAPDDDAVAVQTAFEELGRLSFAEHSLESVLHRVTALADEVLPGDPVTSITIVDGGRPVTVAASDELAQTLDEEQYRLGAGPCLAAAKTGRRSEIVDTRTPTRWAEFAARAAERGCGSVLSYPLPVQERVTGALNVYSRRFTVPDRRTVDRVSRLAAYAVVPVSNMYLYESAVERAGHLQTALDSRAVIDQAKGILMERFKLTADLAFQVLTRVSMESNVKVRDVAERFVRTGELTTE